MSAQGTMHNTGHPSGDRSGSTDSRERRAGPTGDLIELESDRPSPAKLAAVENAISQAAFSIERIDKKWPGQRGNR